MEGLVSFRNPSDWEGKSVFLTGHTGFKGSWLALWLHQLGAKVHGYALDPPTDPSAFEVASVAGILASDTRADLADAGKLKAAISAASPELVFHLAAQPLVRASYLMPAETFATNIQGTVHVLDAVRACPSVRAAVMITTDKVYQNNERGHPYREDDRLGGHDPYSASKAAAEIVVASMRDSFFHQPGAARVATARAGNVIGGGDWADARLVPDCLRSFAAGEPVRLRFPRSVRPWQHVLEPLDGYLTLAAALMAGNGGDCARAWNFGPDPADNAEVGDVAKRLAVLSCGDAAIVTDTDSANPHEAGLLTLDNSAARERLGWKPKWPLGTALEMTVEWHRKWLAGDDMREVTLEQIKAYRNWKP